MQGTSPMQVSKRRSTGAAAAIPYADPDALAEVDLWQGIVHMLQAAKRKLGGRSQVLKRFVLRLLPITPAC